MDKIKILVVPSDTSGCGYFRSRQPHIFIQENYSDLFDIDIIMGQDFPKDMPYEKFFAQYDIIHIHKQLDNGCQMANLIKFLGKILIVDVDDHWNLGDFHPMSLTAKKENWAKPIIDHIKLADYVTTTTPIFAKEIMKYNKNVIVFPNAINPKEEQFIPKPTTSNRLRIGMICGSSHINDFKLMDTMVKQLPKEYLDKIQFVLCGFDTNGTRTIHYTDTNQTVQRPIEPKESVWYEYEKILTNDYKILSEDHTRFLNMFIKNMEYPNLDEPYRRCWTKDINHYATHYNNIDVLLVPLKECDFNKVKSQLKVIEAGFFNKAIIAQNYGPYTLDLKSMITKGGEIDESGNALLVDTSKNHKQWAKYIKKLVDEPQLVEKLQHNLHETVKDKYCLETVAKDRARKYLEMMGVTDVTIK